MEKMRKTWLILLAIMLGCYCHQHLSAQQKTPTFDEMWNFCEKALEELQQPVKQVIPKIDKMPTTPLKPVEVPMEELSPAERIPKIRAQEQKDIREALTEKVRPRLSETQYFDTLISFGLFQEALQFLEELKGWKDGWKDEDPRYHMRAALSYRGLGNETECEKAMQRVQQRMETLKKKGRVDARKVYKDAKELQEKYELKMFMWKRLNISFKSSKKEAEAQPTRVKAWEELVRCARGLGYKFEELVALRILYELTPQSKDAMQDLAKAYQETFQPQKAEALHTKKLK